MEPEEIGTNECGFVSDLLEMNPQKFKSFLSREINEKISHLDLTESQALFVLVLNKDNGLSLKEMTDRLGVHKSLTTRMTKHLIGSGFAINTAESGREYSVVLTKKGLEAKKVISKAFEDIWSLVFQELTPEEREMLHLIFVKIHNRIRELSEQEPER
jgi:Transcriptional regulators